MGKKHVIKQTTDELLAEGQAVEGATQKAAGVASRPKMQFREGVVYVLATYNNTLLTLTDAKGNVLGQVSAGAMGFRATKKSTPFAAARVAEALAEKAKKLGMERVSVLVKGIGSGRESAIRSLATHGIQILRIKDMTPVPHNGPRPKKPRRV